MQARTTGTATSRTAPLRWLFAPAADSVPRGQAGGAAFLRVLLGLMWLHNVSWKVPPDFGDADGGLYKWTAFAVSHPVFPPYSWAVEKAVLPNIEVFGWGVLLAESALAVLLLTGAWVRLAAALGVGMSLSIGLSVAEAPHEWPWAYWLMIGAHVAILFSSAGRAFAVDALRAGLGSARGLGQVWGAIVVVIGALAVAGSAGDDALAASGHDVKAGDLMISFGRYNLVGSLVLVLAGVLLLFAARGGSALLGRAAAAVAAGAALTLHAQIGFSDPLLGGTATSAALLLSVALVAAAVASNRNAVHTKKKEVSGR
ncbi:Rv1678 family membrane protein [Streptomyces sp. UG1]|uniref:Rv1678 family membrane protein n=1 Tax=Streptomyces sp. UG1 TaxID=3417652 RepID=UPI003CF85DDF